MLWNPFLLFRFGNVYGRKDATGDLLLICERKVLPNHNGYYRHNQGCRMQECVLSVYQY
jgi:hypothetical protein